MMKLWPAVLGLSLLLDVQISIVDACEQHDDCNCLYHYTDSTDIYQCADNSSGEDVFIAGTACPGVDAPSWSCYCNESGTCAYSRSPPQPTEEPTSGPTPVPSLRPSVQASTLPSTSSVPSTSEPTETRRGSVRGYVFNDFSRDGLRDNDESPLFDQTIDLYCLRARGIPGFEGTTQSAIDGTYVFNDIEIGQCYIQVTPLIPEYIFSPQQLEAPNGNRVDENGRSANFEILHQDTYINMNAGMYLPTIEPTKEPTQLLLRDESTPSPTKDELTASPTEDELTASPSVDGLQTSRPTDGLCNTECTNKNIDPVLGYPDCGWGVWNDCICECVCDPGVCLSANQMCYDGCTTHLDFNPYGGCKPGLPQKEGGCPWYRSKLGEPHCESSANFAGVHGLRESAELCCKQHFGSLNQEKCIQDSKDDVAAEQAKVESDLARQKHFYPDMYGKLNCVYDSGYEDWMMKEHANYFLFDTADDCCSKWYPAKDDCPILDFNDSTTPQLDYKPNPNEGYYYPHLSGSNCRFGRNYPQFMINSPKHYLYSTPSECCSKWYPGEVNCPMSEDDGVQDGLFFDVVMAFHPNWKGNWCELSGDYPEWMADPTQRDTHLFETAEDCCNLWFPSKSTECQDNIIEPGDEPSTDPPSTWYPSLNGQYLCSEGTPPTWMAAEGYKDEYVFDSHAECCKAHFCEDLRGVVQS